jgi:hypothetical protein
VNGLATFRATVGDLARPFAIWSSSGAAAIATVRIAWAGEDFSGAAIFIGAVWAGVGALYASKSWEKNTEVRANADVEKSKTTPPPPAPGTANIQAAPDVTVDVTNTEPKP